jgi:hypothetical protein
MCNCIELSNKIKPQVIEWEHLCEENIINVVEDENDENFHNFHDNTPLVTRSQVTRWNLRVSQSQVAES